MVGTHEATFYVLIKATRNRWSETVSQLNAAKMTQGKPANVPADHVAIKLKVRMPDAAFDALTPEAVVVVPDELIQRPIEVEAVEGA